MTKASLYQKDFIKRSQNLKHQGVLKGQQIEADNPLCGDRQVIYLDIQDNKFKSIKFEPVGCMVSQVATDLVIDELIGKDIAAIKTITTSYVEKLMQIDLTQSRHSCVNLGLNAIKDFAKEA